MMIILPPQHGNGGRQSDSAAASVPVPLHSALGCGAARSSRARDACAAASAGQQTVVTDALKALGGTWSRKRRLNSP
jgi:hypothetical protein